MENYSRNPEGIIIRVVIIPVTEIRKLNLGSKLYLVGDKIINHFMVRLCVAFTITH
jgi:hypothetical protein